MSVNQERMRGGLLRQYPQATKAKRKMQTVMHEFKAGELHSGKSKKKVKSRKQAIAIGLSASRKAAHG